MGRRIQLTCISSFAMLSLADHIDLTTGDLVDRVGQGRLILATLFGVAIATLRRKQTVSRIKTPRNSDDCRHVGDWISPKRRGPARRCTDAN